MIRGPLPALLLALSFPAPAALHALPQADAGPPAERVNAAIDRGVAFLLRSQNRDGSWGVDINERGAHWHDLRDGACSLAVFTLLKCGFQPDHPAIRRALAFLLESQPRHTYAAGVQLHVLGALHDPAQRKRMQQLLDVLLDLRQSGGWDYPGLGRADLSNTQVAALGLRAAHEAGLELPKSIWSDLVEFALRHQAAAVDVPDGPQRSRARRRMAGFAYEPGGVPSASMTTAGLTILGIAMEDESRVDHRFDVAIEAARELALNWLEQHFSVEKNPEGEAAWHYYYLYGLERVGAFGGLERIGEHDWYAEGAAQLLEEQRAEGSWRHDGRTIWPIAPMETANTCFALLFLRKATVSGESHRRQTLYVAESKAEVGVRIDAKQSWTLWISGFAPEVLERARAAGGGLRVERVERVEWWVGGELAGSVAGDAAQAWKDERYPLRYEPQRSGELAVECRVTARDAADRPLELRSESLAVASELVLEPWMLEYARDAAKSLFAGQEIAVTVSSEESEFHHEGYLLDGLQGSAWWAREADPSPWVRLEHARGLRMKELWISPAAASEALRDACAAFETLELRLNGAKTPLVIEMERDYRLKTKFVLPKPTLVRELELRFMGPSREPGKCVGLAEIEAR